MTFTALMLAMAAIAQGPPPATGAEITREEAAARLAQCGARRFESVAEFEVDGKTKRSRLELCAADSETDAEWIAKLEKNEATVKAQTRLPESARFKLLTDLRAEIDRLKGEQRFGAVRAEQGAPPAEAVVALGSTSDFEISALPPIPAPKAASRKPAPPPPAITETTATPPAEEFAALPPLPAPIEAPKPVAALAKPAGPPTIKPRVSILCAIPGGNAVKCDTMSFVDGVEVRADENLGSPLVLTFLRHDSDRRGVVRVAKLKSGDYFRFKFPYAVCKGANWINFDVQISGAGSGGVRYLDTQGPFRKRC